jgi:hypothetical protein
MEDKLDRLFRAGETEVRVEKIKAGPRHNLALLSFSTAHLSDALSSSPPPQRLFVGWGASRHGQLGSLPSSSTPAPRKTTSPQPVILPTGYNVEDAVIFSMSKDHSAILLEAKNGEERKLWLVGSGKNRQRGVVPPASTSMATGKSLGPMERKRPSPHNSKLSPPPPSSSPFPLPRIFRPPSKHPTFSIPSTASGTVPRFPFPPALPLRRPTLSSDSLLSATSLATRVESLSACQRFLIVSTTPSSCSRSLVLPPAGAASSGSPFDFLSDFAANFTSIHSFASLLALSRLARKQKRPTWLEARSFRTHSVFESPFSRSLLHPAQTARASKEAGSRPQ